MKSSEFLKFKKSDVGFMILLSILFAMTLGYYFGTQYNFENKATFHNTGSS